MPEIVRFYLGEEPILKNVPTWRCREPDALKHVLDNLAELVVKEVAGSGGYGMLVGPKADKATIETFAQKLKAHPGQLHRPADARALDLAHLRRRGHRAAPRRPAALRADRGERRADRAGRTDARRAQGGIAGGEFQPGRRNQGHLDRRGGRSGATPGSTPGSVPDPRRKVPSDGRSPLHAEPSRRQPLLARPLCGARREHRPPARGRLTPLGHARRARRRPQRVGNGGDRHRLASTASRPASARRTAEHGDRLSRLLHPTTRRRSAPAWRSPAPTRARSAPRSPWTCGRRSTPAGSTCARTRRPA